jgi:aryl-alcohol dehydrogenase-like predicted oxidoreductase
MTTSSVDLSKVIVGTAQFGLPYGVANSAGVLSHEESCGIMQMASESGVVRLDTAQAYGTSERVIGSFNEARFEVATKIGPFPDVQASWANWLSDRVRSSKANVAPHELSTLLFHDTTQFSNESRDKALLALRVACNEFPELVFGASIYDPIEWEQLKDVSELNVFQVPFNVFDRRFETSGAIKEMFQMGKVVHVRSAFLQGLLLMDPDNLNPYFSRWAQLLKKWQSHCIKNNQSIIGAAAGFALRTPFVNGVIFGFDSRSQLEELIAELRSSSLEEFDYPDFGELPGDLLDPRRWALN